MLTVLFLKTDDFADIRK